MNTRHRAITIAALPILVASCGGETNAGIAPTGVTGAFTIMTDVPSSDSVTGASYKWLGGFTSAKPACVAQKIGACDVNPCYASASISDGDALTNAGSVAIVGAELSSDVLTPQADSSYVSQVVDTQIPWKTGGENVTIQWAHSPGDATQAGGQVTLGTPPYITLSSGSTFADATTSLGRAQDLTFAWTNESAPATLDHVNVVIRSGSSEVDCTFSAAAGNGVVPSAALQYLTPGSGTFDVHSKEYVAQKISGAHDADWTLQFNVDARARTSYGLAKGSITIE